MALLPLVKGGTRELRAMMKEAREFGVVIGPQFAKNADDFNDNLERMGAVVHGLFLRIADEVLPQLIQFTDWIIDSIIFKLHDDAFQVLLTGYRLLTIELLKVNLAFQQMTTFVGSFAAVLWDTWDPVTALVGAVKDVGEEVDKYKETLQGVERSWEGSNEAAEKQEEIVKRIGTINGATHPRSAICPGGRAGSKQDRRCRQTEREPIR